MPWWLRWTEVVVAVVTGASGVLLGYSKALVMTVGFIPFVIIEIAWFVYRKRRGIPDA